MLFVWCGQQDSNLHAFAVEPKSTESTNSTMPADGTFCRETAGGVFPCLCSVPHSPGSCQSAFCGRIVFVIDNSVNGRIGFSQLPDKLVFVAACQSILSLRTSPQTGVAIPRLEGECTDKHPKNGSSTIFGGNRYLVHFNGGIATPVCALVRNDR